MKKLKILNVLVFATTFIFGQNTSTVNQAGNSKSATILKN